MTEENGLPVSAGHFCILNGPRDGPQSMRKLGTVAARAGRVVRCRME
jgi:hypothetical protein